MEVIESLLVKRTHEMMLNNKKFEVAIDATLGNGHDALYLSKHYKKVIGIDIQELAIKRSKKRLEKIENIEIFLDDFNNIAKYQYANLIIFNLGFLPGSNKKIKTQDYSSYNAVLNAYSILDGVLLVACYIQHDGGYDEYLKIIEALKNNNINYLEEKLSNEILLIIEKYID